MSSNYSAGLSLASVGWTIYLWRKVVCFVLFVSMIHRTRTLQITFLVSLESSWGGGRGALAWFHSVWTCGVEVLEYWMISSLKIKLNRSWNFERNWNVPLVLLERSWWTGLHGIYLVRFGFWMLEILTFWAISAAENSNKFQKPGFGRKKQLRKAQATLVSDNQLKGYLNSLNITAPTISNIQWPLTC